MAGFSPFHFSHKTFPETYNCILTYPVLLAGVHKIEVIMTSCLNNETSQYETYLNEEIQSTQGEHASVKKKGIRSKNHPPTAF